MEAVALSAPVVLWPTSGVARQMFPGRELNKKIRRERGTDYEYVY